MLKLFGPVHSIIAALEPPIGVPVHNGPNTQANLAVFFVLFMLCAIEVVFIKIVISVNDDTDSNVNRNRQIMRHRLRRRQGSRLYSIDDTNNNQYYHHQHHNNNNNSQQREDDVSSIEFN